MSKRRNKGAYRTMISGDHGCGKCRGGWREEEPGSEAWSQETTARTASPQPRFRAAPAGFAYLQGQRSSSLWDDSSSRSQMQEIRDMMGEGPVFDGIEPAEIQQGLLLL